MAGFSAIQMTKPTIIFLAVILLAGCGLSNKDEGQPVAKGGRIYGGTLQISESDSPSSFYPYSISDIITHNVAGNIFEGLVRFDSRNVAKVIPCIAESWTSDPTGTVYTFTLKKGVRFHDDPCFKDGKGREVTAHDVLFGMELLFSDRPDNTVIELREIVKGGKEYFEASKKGKPSFSPKGVRVIDERSIEFTLEHPRAAFLYMLAGPSGYIIPREAFEKYGKELKVGTGPFVYSEASSREKIILTRNPSYHATDSIGNQLPFLDTIMISVVDNKQKELDRFKAGEQHLIFGLPSAAIRTMVEEQIQDFNSKAPKYMLYRTAELMTQYYQFNVLKKPFDDVRVRQAFNYAINRDKIISEVLNTEAFGPGIFGITSPGISGYDISTIKGYQFNPAKAQKLLAEAGYPNGKGFPRAVIETNSGGGKHIAVIDEVAKQLKQVLNIDVEFVVVSLAQKLDDARYARGDMFRAGWVADYPRPENFLQLLYGANVPDSTNLPSYPNTIRYKNPVFDSLYRRGLEAVNQEEGFTELLKAEQIAMDEAPLIVLWYGETLKMSRSFVKGYHFNAMDYKNFSETFLIPADTTARP